MIGVPGGRFSVGPSLLINLVVALWREGNLKLAHVLTGVLTRLQSADLC